MQRQRPTRVGDTLERVLRRVDPDHRMKAFRVWTFWNQEVGDSVAKHAQPDGFRAGVLSVRVDSPTWMQELQFMKESIRSRLNQRLGEPLIQDVYFVSGKTAPAEEKPVESAPKTRRPRPIALPRINNPELAAVFKRIAAAHSKQKT
jgi:predicted nucleic acid-binding Zn ribbon protein